MKPEGGARDRRDWRESDARVVAREGKGVSTEKTNKKGCAVVGTFGRHFTDTHGRRRGEGVGSAEGTRAGQRSCDVSIYTLDRRAGGKLTMKRTEWRNGNRDWRCQRGRYRGREGGRGKSTSVSEKAKGSAGGSEGGRKEDNPAIARPRSKITTPVVQARRDPTDAWCRDRLEAQSSG
jgi:hypothetical protein